MSKRPVLIVLACIATALVLGAGGFTVWALMASPPSQIALEALHSDDSVEVQQDRWLVFLPKGTATLSAAEGGSAGSAAGASPAVASETDAVGFIFYPGGRVDCRAYAPQVRGIAQAGHVAVIVPMPLNLAILGGDAANEVMAAFPMIKRWVIAGHSLGGAVATQYVARNPRPEIAGLVLWGAYAIEDISRVPNLAVLSVAGSLDGLSTPDKIRLNATKLPQATRFVEIKGGNHAQFGSYGPQQGDNPAGLSAAEQRAETISQTAAFLAGLR